MTSPNSLYSENSRQTYVLERKPRFPGNLFKFKEYTAPKILAVFLLLISLIYFIDSFTILLVNNHQSYSTIGSPNIWILPFQTLLKSFVQIFHSAVDIFNIIIIASALIVAYFFTWTVFDPRNVATYILSLTNLILGIMEIISPFDFVPDFLPVVGTLDDGFIGGGLITYGLYVFFKAAKDRDKVETVIELMNEHSEEKALQLLLAQQGISIRKINSSSSST